MNVKACSRFYGTRNKRSHLSLQRLTNDRYVISDVGQMLNVLDANDAILVLPPYVLMHIRRLLRDEIAVRTLEPRRLAALVFLMPRQAALRAIHARTIRAGKSYASVRFPRVVFRQSEERTET